MRPGASRRRRGRPGSEPLAGARLTLKRLLAGRRARATLARLAALYLRLVRATSRFTVVGGDAPGRFDDAGRPMIGCFWHGRLLFGAFACRWQGPYRMMISRHRDGRLIAETVARLGLLTTSGSTSRGAAGAVRQLLAALARGETVGITPDGPRGPRMRAQPGVVKLAQLSGAPVIPVGLAARRRKVLSSWDRFVIIWPFNRIVVVYGDAIFVPRDADAAALERARLVVEESLNAVTAEADRLAGHPPVPPAPLPEAPR